MWANSSSFSPFRPLTGGLSATRSFTWKKRIASSCSSGRRCSPYTCPACFTPRHGVLLISYLSPIFAVFVGIVHAGLAPVIVVGGVKPNLVLVAVILVTCLAGFLPGIIWAFVAGLVANLLVGEPLGSIPLMLLIVSAMAAGGGQVFGGLVWIYPVVAAMAGSIVADIGSLFISQLVTDAVAASPPLSILLVAAILNGAIVAVLLYPARALMQRHASDEAPAW